jgi:hypothetical protein
VGGRGWWWEKVIFRVYEKTKQSMKLNKRRFIGGGIKKVLPPQ